MPHRCALHAGPSELGWCLALAAAVAVHARGRGPLWALLASRIACAMRTMCVGWHALFLSATRPQAVLPACQKPGRSNFDTPLTLHPQKMQRPPLRCVVIGSSNLSIEAAHEVGQGHLTSRYWRSGVPMPAEQLVEHGTPNVQPHAIFWPAPLCRSYAPAQQRGAPCPPARRGCPSTPPFAAPLVRVAGGHEVRGLGGAAACVRAGCG